MSKWQPPTFSKMKKTWIAWPQKHIFGTLIHVSFLSITTGRWFYRDTDILVAITDTPYETTAPH